MRRLYGCLRTITLAWLIGSCGGGEGVVGPPPATVASVTVSRDTATLVPAATVQLSATAQTASGDPLQRTFSWSTSDPARATVSSSGMVVGVAPGTATIAAAADGKSASATITVLDGAVVSSSGGTLNLQSGAVQIVVPAGALPSNTNLSVAVSNAVAGDPRVVTGSAFEFGPPGTNFAQPVVLKIRYAPANLPSATEEAALELYSRTGSGWEEIPQSVVDLAARTVSAPVSHFSTYAVLTPDAVAAIAIGGALPLTVGGSEQLTATLTAADGHVLLNRLVTWSSSDATVASISQTGNLTGVKAGSTTISASAGGKTSSVLITVNPVPPVPVATVTVTPPSASIVVGSTQQLTATLRDANNIVLTGRSISWSSGNAAVATVSATGLVTAVSVGGPVTITATSEGVTGTSSITVTPAPPLPVNTVTVTPPSASIVVGGTRQLTATLRDASNIILTGRTIAWSSNNGAATVDANGLVTAVSVGGPVTITATSEGKSGSSSITVSSVAVASVTLSAATTPTVVGATQQLTAVTRDAGGNVLSDRLVTWASSNTAVLTVSGSGLVTAAGQGTATITATCESVSATTPVITVNPVAPPPVNTVTVAPPSASIPVGGTQQLTATLRDAGNNVLTGRAITWSSNNTAVATVNGSGLVTGAGAGGPVTITATSEGKTGTSSITVTSVAITIRANPFITSGVTAPVFLTQPLNDGRIFVVEQGGRIRVVRDGVLQTTPFLNISGRIINSGERGLLSVAFHPQYATNHFFYVYFIGSPGGEIRIERFTATSDPEVADPASSKLIFTTPHPNGNHNGGLVSFGPDGMLYAAFGDGGGGSPDQDGNGQNFNAYLGGMIRIDVDHGDPYMVPADNPFVGQPNRRPELWAKGFRNPWRYAFDAPSGLLFIADVGEGAREEVDAVTATLGGLNYGWSIMEGLSCFNASSCNQTGLRLPIFDYGHTGGACSITGGYVYRGSAMPAIQGHYFYSDFCSRWLRSLRYQNGVAVDQRDWGVTFAGGVTSFGQDAAGELYVMAGNGVYKLVQGP